VTAAVLAGYEVRPTETHGVGGPEDFVVGDSMAPSEGSMLQAADVFVTREFVKLSEPGGIGDGDAVSFFRLFATGPGLKT
jgi:hypothetical protein